MHIIKNEGYDEYNHICLLFYRNDVYIGYLPLAHVLELGAGMLTVAF